MIPHRKNDYKKSNMVKYYYSNVPVTRNILIHIVQYIYIHISEYTIVKNIYRSEM